MKIRIVIPLWKRPEVTRFCFDNVLRLTQESKHEISVTCVLSEPEYIGVCQEYGFNWVFDLNEPVGKKINTGIKATLKHRYDYLMIMNSDDVIEAELIDRYYQPFFESLSPFFGVKKVTFVNFYTHEAREFEYDFSVLGIGKCVRFDIVKSLNGELYNPKLNRGLDDSMMDRMIENGIFPTFINYEGMLAKDFKSDINIWGWEHFKDKGKKVCYKTELEPVSEIVK